jgi:hypothetical protein
VRPWPLAFAGLASLVACGGSGAVAVKVHTDRIRPAVAAVEKLLGGPQHYSEVNVTETEVNVFVVRNGRDLAYVVHGTRVTAPSDNGDAASGPTFAASQIAFGPNVLTKVIKGLADSEILAFSVTPDPMSGLDYIATVRAKVGELRVLLGPDGSVLSTA